MNQSLTELEIIFIDDASEDNSYLTVQSLMKKDKRIILLKNSINKGQFYSRNKGILNSKGEYILIIDPDDLLLNDILIKSYGMAKKYLLDIVQFYHLIGSYKHNNLIIINRESKICFRPYINKLFFDYHTRYLWDKLIKRTILIKSIYFMKGKYQKERFIIHNDETACFGIFKTANSYGQLKEVGYFYNRDILNSTTKQNFFPKNINGRFHSLFAIMDYYFEQSEDNMYEKNKGGYHFFEYRIVRKYKDKIKLLTEGFEYINAVINKYLKSPFYNFSQKLILEDFKNKVNLQEYLNDRNQI